MLHAIALLLLLPSAKVDSALEQPAAAGAAQGEPVAFSAAVVNDNYTGGEEAGRSGRYIGADDFLTVSYLLRAERGAWGAGFSFLTVTSRKFGFRYDLLALSAQRGFRWRGFELQPGLALLLKGDFVGDRVQNGWHQLRDIPPVDLPYQRGGIGVAASFAAQWPRRAVLLGNDEVTASAVARLYSAFIGSRAAMQLSYRADWYRFSAELLAAYRQFVFEQPGYSEMIRSGPLAAVNLRARIYGQLFFDLGFSVFPVRNLENDPVFLDKPHPWSPQIWTVLSWGVQGRSLRRYIDY